MNLNLDDIGLTQEQLRDRVIDRIAEQLINPSGEDCESDLQTAVEKEYRKQIVEGVKVVAEAAVLPKVQELLDKVTFQETNRWGEAQKPTLTLKEFLIARAEAWMTEKVDYNGKGKAEESYNWTGTQTRIAHMIHQHLHYHIDTSVKKALADVNSQLAKGIEETVKLKLQEALAALKVSTTIGR
jgi:hypothetical protein